MGQKDSHRLIMEGSNCQKNVLESGIMGQNDAWIKKSTAEKTAEINELN